jgi:hypothetical protein
MECRSCDDRLKPPRTVVSIQLPPTSARLAKRAPRSDPARHVRPRFQAATLGVPARPSAAWNCYVSAPGLDRLPTRLGARSGGDESSAAQREGLSNGDVCRLDSR